MVLLDLPEQKLYRAVVFCLLYASIVLIPIVLPMPPGRNHGIQPKHEHLNN